jgi:hypothetical protein
MGQLLGEATASFVIANQADRPLFSQDAAFAEQIGIAAEAEQETVALVGSTAVQWQCYRQQPCIDPVLCNKVRDCLAT